MIDLQKYTEQVQKVEELKRNKDKAEGALEQLKSRLKEEFGCDTIKQGKQLLEEKNEELERAEEEFNAALDAFTKEYGSILGE